MSKLYEYEGNRYSCDQLKKIFENEVEKWKDVRWDETLKLVEGNKVLDFGCSIGIMTHAIGKLGFEAVGIDYRQSDIDIANDFFKLPNTIFEVRDLFLDPFPASSFDCIVFAETIEHVESPAAFLKEFFRILKPRGYLILSTPNATSLKNILYALSYRKEEKRKKIIEEINKEIRYSGTHLEHIFNWDFPTLTRLLNRCGFEIYQHKFVRSGPIIMPFFGKKIEIIRSQSQILKFVPTLMVHHLIKAKKPSD